MARITVDGTEYEVKDGSNLLEAVLGLGLDLPYFCWHPEMGSIGSCRQCAMTQYQDADDDRGKLVMGCMTPVVDGAILSIETDNASKFREMVVESLMLNHPHDCPVCAEGGECHLQDMTVMVGQRDRRYRGLKNTHRNQYLGPLVHHEMNRCIACYRCVRFYRDYAGGTDLAAMASHDHVYFGRHEEGVLQSEFAGNLVEVCPTGVFTDRTLVKDYTRKWDLQSAPGICGGCAVGCNTIPGERYGRLKRIHNRYNHEVNGYFLCDRGRFGGGYVNDEDRVSYAGLREHDGSYRAIERDDALARMAEWCQGDKRLAAIGSPRASIETNFVLQRLVGAQNFASGFSDLDNELCSAIADHLRASDVLTPSLQQIEQADAVLILGEDISANAPRLGLAVRQAARNRGLAMAADQGIAAWQDAAVRNLVQDTKSPIMIASMAATGLDDLAEQRISAAPQDIACIGMRISALLGASGGNDEALSGQSEEFAQRAAAALSEARRPLVISGSGCQDRAVIDAAVTTVRALRGQQREPMLSLCVNEANSLGLALLAQDNSTALSALASRAEAGEIDTLLIAENDLYRRMPTEAADKLLASVKHVIALDVVDTPTLGEASIALPAASQFEAEGTLVSLEGRAQRNYPVMLPQNDRLPSWSWIGLLAEKMGLSEMADLKHFDDVTRACAAAIPALAHIVEAAPEAEHRSGAGVKTPRQPHRYSGRTAMRAHISMHEPKQPEDTDTPLGYTMEGDTGANDNALMPFVWTPGWNSNQGLHRFQQEVGGPMRGEAAGRRLIEPCPSAQASEHPPQLLKGFSQTEGKLQLVPLYRVFGSDELSSRSPALAELSVGAEIELRSENAQALGVSNGDGVVLQLNGQETGPFEVAVNDSLAPGCAGFAAGTRACGGLEGGMLASLAVAADWKPRTQVIASDGGARDV